MGIFLRALERVQEVQIEDFFTGNSLSKVREYYGQFKANAQTYSIDNEQFLQLFGKHEDVFKCFDTDNNLLIEGLQFFSGLILLSRNMSFPDKVGFLFQLFDFNDLKSLAKTDIEFLFISCCTAVQKIYQIKGVSDDSFVEDFVKDEFPSEERVNISEMLKWARKSEAVANFFALLKQQLQPEENSTLPQMVHLRLEKPRAETQVPSAYHYGRQEQFMLDTQRLFRFPDEEGELSLKSHDITPSPAWVYGIRYRDVRQFVEYCCEEDEERLLYFVGKVVILYSIRSRTQRHYLGHQHEIISLALQGHLCASSEYAPSPQIRVWNNRTLETVQILKGCHVQGVHLLRFLENGLLVSCGCLQESPIVIFHIQLGQAIFSAYCSAPAIDIALLSNFTNRPAEEFVVCSLYELYHFECVRSGEGEERLAISMNRLALDERRRREQRITSCCFFMINAHYKHLRQYDGRVEKHVMTGHENGLINVWNLTRRELDYTFSQESNEIVRLIPTHSHLLAITNSSFISYFSIDIQEKEKLKVIDITQIDEQLSSYDICECIVNSPRKKLLIITQKADVFFLNEEECVDAPSISHFTHQKFKTQKIHQLLPIFGEIKMQKLLKKDHTENLYIAVGPSIKAIDVKEHCFIREWNIGQEVVSFDVIHTKAYGLFIVAATVQNKLYLFCNKAEGVSKAKVESEVVSVMIHTEESPATIVVFVSTRESILRYNIVKNAFANPYPLNRANFSPQLSPLEGNKVMLSAQDNKLFALIIKEMHIQALANTDYRSTSPLMKLHYHIPLDNRRIHLPVVVGCQAKALVAGREDGKVYLWTSYEQLSNHNFIALDAHTSPIADLSYTHDQKHLYSCGSEDGMIIQWRLRYFVEEGSATISKMREEPPSEYLNDEFSQRRVDFCKFRNDKLVRNYDQHISIKGIKNDIIRRLFKSNINEWRIHNKTLRLEESNIHLKMNFVFGIETYNQNGSLIALNNPKRFLYFVSKIIVIYYPAQNQQEFYRGHRFKVTSVVLLEDKVRVASGESAYRPSIHIWSTRTLETLRIIKTTHRWGIIQLATHHNILLSFGLKEIRYEEEVNAQNQEIINERTMYSYQMTDYEKGLILATREEKDLVHSLTINPSDPLRFAACHDGRVTFWEVKFNIIIKRKVCWLSGDTPTCCIYYHPPKGQPDLLVGTCSGTLGMINREQYWTVFKKGEKEAKRINCILIVRREAETLIVVATEDNLIKIYNQKLEERFRESMLKIEPIEEGSKKVRESKGDRQDRNCSIQSLSLITEASGKSNGELKEELRILLGTRNGQILELIESKQNRYGSNKAMSFKAILFLRFNTSQDTKRIRNKVLMTHHPKTQIIATIGHDQQILFWDTEHNKLLLVTELNTDNEKKYPTAIKFSHSGDHLIIGFSDGELMFLQSKMPKSLQSKTDEKYCPLNVGKAKREKDEDGQAVLNIQLSQNGEYIAVSYQKIVGEKSYSYIKISHFRIKDKVKSNKGDEKILDNTSILPCPHLEKSFHTQSGLLFGFAAYSLSFAVIQNTSKQYFLSYYQMIDQNQNRMSINIQKGEERNYNIWEVSDSIYPVTSPLIESIKWRKFYIHNAIQTTYIFHDTPLALNQREDSPPSNNNLDLSEFTNMTILDQSILTTSFNGDIHIFKLGTLQGEEEGMIGKTVPAHCCKINQIEQFHNQNKSVIYTTGENDECIIKWTVEKFQGLAENEEYAEEERDLFGEVPDWPQMKTKLELYKKKSDVERVILRNQNFLEWFKVRFIFGRRAEQIRNNLKFDKYDRIIYSSGHAVVTVDPETNMKEFLYVKEDPIHCLQEVTALEISKDGEFLISCHAGTRAGVILWELNSKILLKRFYLKEIVQVLYLIISDDSQRLVVYGITPQMVGQLVMMDVQNEQIMGVVTYSHKKAWQIKSLCFRPNSHDKFFTCGIENIKEWQMMSAQLVNVMSYQNEDTITNTCIDFIGESLLVTNDRGELVIWCDSGEILKREEHQNMITCLAVVNADGLIATGSISSEEHQAQVVIWSFQSNDLSVIEKINVRLQAIPSPILSNKAESNKQPKEADIQSLHLSRNPKNHKVLIGITKGDIYEYSFQATLRKQKSEVKQQQEPKPVMLGCFQDEQKIKAMFFNSDQSQLIEISENGLLRVWSLMKPELQWSHNFDLTAVNMVYSSKNQLVIIAFRETLRFFKYAEHQDKPLIEVQLNITAERFYTHLVLGPNQKFFALGKERNSDKANIIQIFEITSKQCRAKIKVEDVRSPILFIDFSRFSSEHAYIFYNTVARPELFDLILGGPVNNQQIGEIDWMSHGLQFSNKVKKTKMEHEQRFRDSTITRIIEVQSGYIFLDYYAGVYLYREGKLVANCHLNISSIDTVTISASQRWLAVGSKVDRNIVLIELSQLVAE